MDAQARPVAELLHELQMHQLELEKQKDELKRAQISLQEARDRYIDLYDFAPAGCITFANNELIEDINITGAALLGEERGRLANCRFDSFVAPADVDKWHRHFMSVTQGDDKQSCELTLLRNDGSCLDVQLNSIRLVRDDNQLLVRIALTDITALKRMEAALRESEMRRRILEQQEIVQTSLDGFWVVNSTNGRIIEVNDKYCAMIGFSREEMLNMNVRDLEANETPEDTEKHLEKVREIGYDRFETRHRHKLGTLVDLEVSVSRSDLNADVNFAFFRDITRRKRDEEALNRSHAQLKAFIQQAPIGIAMFDREMNYLATSGRWISQYGRGHADLTGLNHYKLYPDISADRKSIHRQALAGATLEKNEDTWYKSDGTRQWARWAVQPWVDESGSIGGIIMYAEDITAQKLLELEIQAQRKDMEHLHKIQIATQTTAAIAHELNQPLLSIASYSGAALMLMQAEAPNLERLRKIIEKNEKEALRAGRSIRELMDYLNQKEYPAQDVDLNDEILNVLNIARSEHDLSFETILRLNDGLPKVRINSMHLQKVLLNLLSNGIEAMEQASVPLPSLIVTVRTKKDENVAHLTLQDNGPGIRQEDMHRLFEPFFTTKAKGIGMGLVISRSLIEGYGGQLWVDPQPGAGATFHLTLPFAT
ncbi:sensor histidine kinase TodS [mine drainage metagenome]|uniref:histidine kinase n=1 Tax=mine drainage metagenome TaxID=410659 RepID=A0A1J5RZV4_9ZZZZ